MATTTLNGRPYIHKNCDTMVSLAKSDTEWLANPWWSVTGTVCPECGIADLNQCVWEDTGEDLASFRKRMARETPSQNRLICLWILPILGAILGYLVSNFIPVTEECMAPLIYPIGGIFIGAAIPRLGLAPFLIPILNGRNYSSIK